jgi:hypothetical protein
MNREDICTWTGFAFGLLIGFFLGAIVRSLLTYWYLCIKDWFHKRKEREFTLGRNLKTGHDPTLISIDDD